MTHEFYVYLLLDPRYDNEPFYVGKGRGARSQHHLLPSHTCGNRLKINVINKIREAGFEPIVDFVVKGQAEDAAIVLEKQLIKKYGRRDLGLGKLTNLTDGGEGLAAHVFTEEHRRNISLGLTGKKLSLETRAKQSESAKRRVRPPMSDETKAKIGAKTAAR
jgi:hypothetical protein